jgi:hypothetical protein
MTMRSSWQITGSSLILVAVLLLVLVAAFALAASTPWVLDQPLSPYNWMIVP